MELKYTPKIINEIEVEASKPLQEILSSFSMKNIVLFVKKGLSIDQEKAYDEIDAYLKEGKDTVQLYMEIVEKLQDAGFLPRQVNVEKMKDKMNEEMKKAI